MLPYLSQNVSVKGTTEKANVFSPYMNGVEYILIHCQTINKILKELFYLDIPNTLLFAIISHILTCNLWF